MRFANFYRALSGILLTVFIPSAVFAAPTSYDDSVDTALSIYHAAVRQAESAVAVIRAGKYDMETSDNAYEKASVAAIWEGIKVANPRATIEQRKRMANLIRKAKMLATASGAAAHADYIAIGKTIDDFAKRRIKRDQDDAFRLGYAQAVRRDIELSH